MNRNEAALLKSLGVFFLLLVIMVFIEQYQKKQAIKNNIVSCSLLGKVTEINCTQRYEGGKNPILESDCLARLDNGKILTLKQPALTGLCVSSCTNSYKEGYFKDGFNDFVQVKECD